MTNQVIPQPDNPEHTDNLANVPLMEQQGFVGSDRDLATSLFEYGMAWRDLGDGQWLIVYAHP